MSLLVLPQHQKKRFPVELESYLLAVYNTATSEHPHKHVTGAVLSRLTSFLPYQKTTLKVIPEVLFSLLAHRSSSPQAHMKKLAGGATERSPSGSVGQPEQILDNQPPSTEASLQQQPLPAPLSLTTLDSPTPANPQITTQSVERKLEKVLKALEAEVKRILAASPSQPDFGVTTASEAIGGDGASSSEQKPDMAVSGPEAGRQPSLFVMSALTITLLLRENTQGAIRLDPTG